MTNKEKSAELVNKYVQVFSCPFCKRPMKVTDLKSLVCLNNHTFDFAKQGYVNMLTRSTNSQYKKELFTARHQIIVESDLYASLHEKVLEVINENRYASKSEIMILDVGCGEGSHLQRVLDDGKNKMMVGVGLDITKEGIKMAASRYRESIWLVGDLANLPMADQSCHVILNILSPANYKQFKRVLVPNGLVIKIVPRSNYLSELREALFGNTDKGSYKNDETVSLYKQHFHVVDLLRLRYTKELTQIELINLVHMSPLAWNKSKDDIDRIIDRDFFEVTVDLDILIGINKLTKGDRV